MSIESNSNLPAEEVLLSHAKTELLVGGVGAALVAGAVWMNGQMVAVLGWLCVIETVYLFRFFQARRLANSAENTEQDVIKKIQFGLMTIGVLWGAVAAGTLVLQGLAWSTILTLVSSVVLSILVLGTYLGHRALVLPFVFSATLPVAIAGAVLLQRDTIVVALTSMIFMAVISAATKYVDQMFKSLYTTSDERDRFYSMLKVSEQEIQRLKVGVKTNSEKRVELENELQTRDSELQVTKGKAEALSSALERVSPYDTETGLLNAKKFKNVIDREWARMLRQELPLTIVYTTLDNFEGYQDTYGKIALEAAIRKIGELIKTTGSRPGDVAARVDEYKFAILLPEADHKNGERLSDQLRENVRALNMPNANSPMHSSVTASFGVATVIPNSDLTVDDIVSRADSALYEAQFQGGDKVIRYRTMNTAKLERWNIESEGEFSAEGLVRKLAVWGYDAKPKTLNPGDYQPDRRIQVDMVDAIVEGSLKVTMEGESRVLHAGDCLFLPKGVVTSTEVVGDKSVVCLEALRS